LWTGRSSRICSMMRVGLMLDQFGMLSPWLRVLVLLGMWLLLGSLLALGVAQWWRRQRQTCQREAARRRREEQVMDLLKASKRMESRERKRPT